MPKGTRRLGQVDEMILPLYARGTTTRDITAHLAEVYGADVSPALVSKVTDVIADEVQAWQRRPLDECYPILYVDAVRIKVHDNGHVVNKAARLVIGVDVDGIKNVLAVWFQDNEGAKFWLHVLTQLKHRGLTDVLIVCCDGLKRLPEAIEAIEAIWLQAITQTCVVHLIRSALRYVNSTDRTKVAAALKPVYTAVDETAAHEALERVREDWGRQYPGTISVFENAWAQFIPFLDFDQDIRRVIYTTNAIESMNRKLVKTCGHFPSDDAAMKMLYLGIRNLEGRHIDGNGNVPAGRIRGTGTLGWTRAMNQFKNRFGDRLPL
ncbi:IS256 family transposase [Streptomyces lavendulae subsp. grasserius]